MRFYALPTVEAPKSTIKVVKNMLLKKVVPTLAVGFALSMGVAAPAIAVEVKDPAPITEEQPAPDQGKDAGKTPQPGDKAEPGKDAAPTEKAQPADPGAEKEVKNKCHDKAFYEGKIKELLTSWGEKVTFGNFGSEEAKADVKAGFDEFLPGANFDKAYKYIKGAFEAKTWSNSANLEAAIMDALNEQGLVSDSCEVPGVAKGENASAPASGDQTVLEGQNGDSLAQTGSVIGLAALGALACGAGAAGSFAVARRKSEN